MKKTRRKGTKNRTADGRFKKGHGKIRKHKRRKR